MRFLTLKIQGAKSIPVGWREGGREILKNQKMVLECDN
jgi:hypothetical protein